MEPKPTSQENFSTPKVVLDDRESRNWAVGIHLSALSAFLGIPFGNILGPLVVWLIKKNDSGLIEREGRKVLNFQISMTVYFVAALPTCLLLIGFLLIPVVLLVDLIFTIMGAVKTSNNQEFKYPFTIEFIK